MYKIKNNLSPPIIADLFEQRNEQHYNLRNWAQFSLPAIRTVYHGSESISFLGPKIWNMLPDKLKNASSLEVFKASIKSWKLSLPPLQALCSKRWFYLSHSFMISKI